MTAPRSAVGGPGAGGQLLGEVRGVEAGVAGDIGVREGRCGHGFGQQLQRGREPGRGHVEERLHVGKADIGLDGGAAVVDGVGEARAGVCPCSFGERVGPHAGEALTVGGLAAERHVHQQADRDDVLAGQVVQPQRESVVEVRGACGRERPRLGWYDGRARGMVTVQASFGDRWYSTTARCSGRSQARAAATTASASMLV